jgi:hypothetical protein
MQGEPYHFSQNPGQVYRHPGSAVQFGADGFVEWLAGSRANKCSIANLRVRNMQSLSLAI